ncbi:MAG: hypothetical protein AAB336_01400, partial [Acidobacteriota bacterium]
MINDFNFVSLGLGGLTTALNTSLRPANILNSATARGNWDSAFPFLLGRIASLSTNYNYNTQGVAQVPGTGKKRNFHYNEYEFYATDNWRIRNDLTLNLGVRYYLYPAPFEANGLQAGNDVDYDALIARRIANGAAGISGANAEPLLRYTLNGKENNGRPLYQTDKNNFAPRIGFAYNPSFRGGPLGVLFGERKTVLRGGFSIVYDRVAGAVAFIQDQVSYLFDNSASRNFGSLSANTALLLDPRFQTLTNLPVATTPPAISNPFTPFGNDGLASGEFNYAVAQNFEVPFSYQWSFGMQRELPGNFLLDVSYVGRKGKKLFSQADAAQIIDFKDPASGQFMLAALNAVQAQINNGSPITAQPWFENQIGPLALAKYGIPCTGFGVANCTEVVSGFFGNLVQIGDA